MPTTKLVGKYWATIGSQKHMAGHGRLKLFLGVMLVLLIAAVGVTYWLGHDVIAANERVIRQQLVVNEVERTLSAMKDAETGQRGYLLTGDIGYLKPYTDAKSKIQTHMAALRKYAAIGEIDSKDMERLTALASAKLAELDQTITLRQRGDAGAALEMVRSGRGIALMDEIRVVVGRMREWQAVILQDYTHKSEVATTLRSVIFVLLAATGIMGSLWGYRQIVMEMERRAKAATELAMQRDLVSVTLGSIGDAVIVTDSEAKVAFMNAVAEGLTGWTQAQAAGMRLEDVFRIINEESRATVESPVAKVLRLGVVVGLANHTLLIRKDGSEVPIDDSGAPIRDDQGHVYGVVLVFRDFSEHKNAEKKLIEARDAADAANRAKDQFMATLSHELRTPLTPVLATLGIWEGSSDIPADLLPDIQMLRRNVDLEVRLIDDLLDLTRIAKGKLSLNMETVDVHDLLNSVVGIVQSDVNVKHLTLRIDLASKRHFVRADSARLQQIMWNVLKNAVKFTQDGGHISVQTIDGAPGQLEMIFRDNGIGMSGETLERLFHPFEQGTGDTPHRYGGLGLGMALSKALVEAQGGKIRAESKGLGQGATFVVTLPVVEGAIAAAKAPAFPAKHLDGKRLQILLVEDHADTAKAMTRILVGFGHQVKAASSVEGALALSRGGPFDLMLSDIGLPDGTGIELVQRIHAERPLPAVALTGFGMEDDVTRCKEAGFIAHLTKPVNLRALQTVIEGVVGKAGA